MIKVYPGRTAPMTAETEGEALQHIVTLSVRKGVVSAGSAVPTWQEYLGDLMNACLEANDWLHENGVPDGPTGTYLLSALEDAFDEAFSTLAWHTGFDLASLNPDYSDRAELLNREIETGRWE